MSFYSKELGERVLRILARAERISSELVETARSNSGATDDGELLTHLLDNGSLDVGLVHTVISRAYALRRAELTDASISIDAFGTLPIDLIEKHKMIPYALDEETLHVALVDPTEVSNAANLRAIAGKNIEFALITHAMFKSLFEGERIQSVIKASKRSQTENNQISAGTSAKTRRSRFPLDNDELTPELCDHILYYALEVGASDIHIEVFRESARVRMRIDGVLQTVGLYSEYLFAYYEAIIARFKILAGADISEKRLPQDGAITIPFSKTEEVDLRFNVLPGKNGERIVMRVLRGDPSLQLDRLGIDKADYDKIIDAIQVPQGMVLVTGPTGSGKTTTLYGALQHVNSPRVNIMTAEDPVEYYLEGIGQVQANERIGLSFASILRAFLRQDPEIILVGEIRDQETVDIAVKAALTGHLLLSTLHTNDAVATITRMTNMGVPNFMVSAALSLVVAQRLARPNCQHCLVSDPISSPQILTKIGFNEIETQNVDARIGKGCENCNGSGLKGRRGIYEVLRVTDEVEEEILRGAQANEIIDAARKDGFRTMQEIGRQFIAEGILSIAEYQRVLVMG